MNNYKKRAIFELERGNYQQYQKKKQLIQNVRKEQRSRMIADDERKNSIQHSSKPTNASSSECKSGKRVSKTDRRSDSWNEMHRSFLREHYKRLSDRELGNCLGRSAEAVKCERKKLKLLHQHANRRWTTEEDTYLLANYKNLEYKEISKKLNRKPKQISARLNQLGRSKIHCYDLVINGYTVASGTIKEIAGQLNANLYTVKRWRTDGVSWAEFIKLDQ
jgi:aspartyl-tRNA synthetase